jgi:hypothetical protein
MMPLHRKALRNEKGSMSGLNGPSRSLTAGHLLLKMFTSGRRLPPANERDILQRCSPPLNLTI